MGGVKGQKKGRGGWEKTQGLTWSQTLSVRLKFGHVAVFDVGEDMAHEFVVVLTYFTLKDTEAL